MHSGLLYVSFFPPAGEPNPLFWMGSMFLIVSFFQLRHHIDYSTNSLLTVSIMIYLGHLKIPALKTRTSFTKSAKKRSFWGKSEARNGEKSLICG